MFDLDKWQEIFDTMRRNKLRTFLTAFGVFWGIFILVVLLGSGRGLENGVKRGFGGDFKNSYWIWGGKTSMPSHGLKPGRQIIFTNQDLEEIAKQTPNVRFTAPRSNISGEYVVKYKDKNGSFRMFGATGDFFQVNGEKLNKGRFLNTHDEQQRRKVLVLGERAKEVLFGKDDAIGKWVDVKGIFFQVVGIYNSTQNNGRNEERGYIPFSTYQNAFGQHNRVQLIAVGAENHADPKEVKENIRRILANKHKFSEEDTQAMDLWSTEEEMRSLNSLFTGISMFVWVIGVMTLIAGIVGVSNIMLIIVQERTREIGVRKALGATPFSIVSLIITESIVITSMAGYMGLLTGASLLSLVSGLITQAEADGADPGFFYNPSIDLMTGLQAVIVLVIAGALAGLMPALRAANIKPIEALRAD